MRTWAPLDGPFEQVWVCVRVFKPRLCALDNHFQWLIQRTGPGDPPSLICRPKWGPKGRKKLFLRPPPPLISGSGWPPPLPPPLSEGLDPPLIFHTNFGPWVYVLGDKVLSYGTITGLKFLDRILCPFWTAWSLALPLSPPYWLLNFFLIRYEHLFPSAKLTLTDQWFVRKVRFRFRVVATYLQIWSSAPLKYIIIIGPL